MSGISDTEKNAFVLGSVYLDALPKAPYHSITATQYLLSHYTGNSTRETWFLYGLLAHISVDLYGHFGRPYGFLPLRKSKHYIAELASCSYVYHKHKIRSLKPTESALSMIDAINGVSDHMFPLLYRVWRLASAVPTMVLLPRLDATTSQSKSFQSSVCTLERHIEHILGAMDFTIQSYKAGNLSDDSLMRYVRSDISRIAPCS